MTKIDTLSDFFISFNDRNLNQELERHRAKYESIHGPTDITRYYTSRLPAAEQDWLIKHFPQRWLDGLPPYVKSFYLDKAASFANDGALDNVSDAIIEFYVRSRCGNSGGRGR